MVSPCVSRGASPRGRRSRCGIDADHTPDRRISAWAEEPPRAQKATPGSEAHLRVGGGACSTYRDGHAALGASPRGRRSRPIPQLPEARRGRISAWAEEPPRCCRHGPRIRGASPRGRRSRAIASRTSRHGRRISAWAEEPAPSTASTSSAAAHLRVGGGASGSYARARARTGASPRGRRSRPRREQPPDRSGRISAWAEEPTARPPTRPGSGAHLRVGGGAHHGARRHHHGRGASPRGRRSRGRQQHPRRLVGAHLRVGGGAGRRVLTAYAGRISAWAEEPRTRASRSRSRRAHLRVGGGANPSAREYMMPQGASPRGRRSRDEAIAHRALGRRISAWAEEPRLRRPTPGPAEGASPRGRRSRAPEREVGDAMGRISACWAEEPETCRARPWPESAHLRVGGGAQPGGSTATTGTR